MPHLINETFLENGRSKIQSSNEIRQFCYMNLFQLSKKKKKNQISHQKLKIEVFREGAGGY